MLTLYLGEGFRIRSVSVRVSEVWDPVTTVEVNMLSVISCSSDWSLLRNVHCLDQLIPSIHSLCWDCERFIGVPLLNQLSVLIRRVIK